MSRQRSELEQSRQKLEHVLPLADITNIRDSCNASSWDVTEDQSENCLKQLVHNQSSYDSPIKTISSIQRHDNQDTPKDEDISDTIPSSICKTNRICYEINDNYEIRIHSPARENLLPKMSPDGPEYTLVLDLDETLIHYIDQSESTKDSEDNGFHYFNVRPYATQMLKTLSKYYEIVVFTAGTQDYADMIINNLPGNENIKYRLYRRHTIQENDVYIKDLGILGRDLKKTLIVDNTQENFMYHKHNGISIKSWYEDPHDSVLKDLTKILIRVVQNTPDNICQELQSNWRFVLDKYIHTGVKVPNEYLH